MYFLQKHRPPPTSPNYFITIARKLYRECGIEHLEDIKKSNSIYIFHGQIRKKNKEDSAKHVLVKVLLGTDKQAITAFENESFYYNRFNHDHLIRKEFSSKISFGYNIGRKHCLILEYIDGIDLELLLHNLAVTKNKIMERAAIDITIKVLSALNEVHNLKDKKGKPLNIVHADISPHNILISKKGQVKLIDFGISVVEEKAQKIQNKITAGKISYMSPEQLKVVGIDKRTDIFSMGIVLAEMLLAAKLNPKISNIEKVKQNTLTANYPAIENSDINGDLKKIIYKALNKDPDLRYQSANEMIAALLKYLEQINQVPRQQDILDIVEFVLSYLRSEKTVFGEGVFDSGTKEKATDDIVINDDSENRNRKYSSFSKVALWLLPIIMGFFLAVYFLYPKIINQTKVNVPLVTTDKDNKTETGSTETKDELQIPSRTADKKTTKVWTPDIMISAPSSTIVLTNGDTKKTAVGNLVFNNAEYKMDDKEQKYSLAIMRKGYLTKHLNFVLTPEKNKYENTITLQEAGKGTLVARADDIVKYWIPGFVDGKNAPFEIKLYEGRHNVTVKWDGGLLNPGETATLKKSIQIKPDQTITCIAYVGEENKYLVCE